MTGRPLRHAGFGLAFVLVVALAVRLAACAVWAHDLTLDRDVYLGIAQQVAAGQGWCTPNSLKPTAYRPPLYPLLLASVLIVASPAAATATVNVLAGLAAVTATWVTARRMGMEAFPAMSAALLVAVDPLLVRYTSQPMTECTFTALTITALAGLSALHAEAEPPGVKFNRSLLTGVILGLAALCRPTIWPFAAMSCGWLLVDDRRPWRGRLSSAIALGVALFATVAPWAVRNALVMGEPLVTTTHGGYTLFLANNSVFYREVARQPWGVVWERESLERWQRMINAEAAAELNGDTRELAIDRWQARRAWHAMGQDPVGFAAAVAYRVRSLWSLSPRGEAQLGTWESRLLTIWYALLFALAAWGLWLQCWRDARWAVLLMLFIACLQAVHLLYWTDTRMRAPLHPVLALLAVLPVRECTRLARAGCRNIP